MKDGYDDGAWQTGLPPFGAEGKRVGRTPWKTSDICLRKSFEFDGRALRNGANTLAAHTRQTNGGQIIDLALLAD